MKKNILALAILATAITACSSGGDDSAGNDRPAGTIAGKAVDAKLINSTISAYRWNQGVAETTPVQGGTAETDAKGDYTMNPVAEDGYFLLKATSGYYVEEATGVKVDLSESQSLSALVRYESGKAINLHITGLTHLAACQAEYRAKKIGNNNSDAVDLSNDLFSVVAGVAVREVEPLDITDPNNASPFMTAGLQYGMFTAAVSSLTKELAELSGQSPHTLTSTTSIHFYQIACNDIRADGKLDGQGYTNGTLINQLAFGTQALSPSTYRTSIAQHMLKMAASDKNKTGLDVNAYLNRANALSMMDSDLFNNEEPTPVDMTGPSISINVAANTYMRGSVNLSFTIEDVIGVKNISYYADDLFVSSGSASNTILALNTTGYSDGQHTLKVVATDALDNATTFTRIFNFDNSGPVVNLTSAALVNSTSYLATGTYEESGAEVTGIVVKGVNAALNTTDKTWSANITLVSGGNNFNITATDAVANSNQVQAIVNVDLIKPTISPLSTNVLITTYQGLLNLCTSGSLGASTPANPLCVSTDNVSLNGTSIDPLIQNNGFVLIGFTPDDPQGAGVFTSRDDLVVEYMYERGAAIVKDWSIVPTQVNGSKASYYLPLVTEYLGNTWYNTTTDESHKISIRVTDAAGNSTSSSYTLRFDVLVPTIAFNTAISNSNMFTGANFATRSTVDGQLVNITYSVNNESNTAYYISLSGGATSNVAHTYETGIRKNRARVDWQEERRAKLVNVFCYVGCSAAQENEYTDVSNNVYVWNGNSWTLRDVITTSGVYADYTTDIVSVTATNWTAISWSEAGCDVLSKFSSSDVSVNNRFGVVNSLKYICADGSNTGSYGIRIYFHYNDYQKRNTPVITYADGYPRNEFTDTTANTTIQTESISVYNNTLGQIINPVNGWYRIPPNTSIAITKALRNPVITHYNDTEVTSPLFASYIDKKLDKTTTWSLDTNLNITRAIDPGSVANLPNVTQYTETVGNGTQSYTIAR